MGENCVFFRRGTPCAQPLTEGAGTAVSGHLKRFSQAEIFNLLRENKAEKKQEDKKKLIIHRPPPLPPPSRLPYSLHSHSHL